MMIMVFCAFFHSTGWKAGTPLATASVPVMAEQPSAKALHRRKMPMVSVPTPVSGATSLTWARFPVIDWNTPATINSSIEPMKM